ncbi:hypothetical protein ABPG74_006616, partial [Tetrahymena malaccensis]
MIIQIYVQASNSCTEECLSCVNNSSDKIQGICIKCKEDYELDQKNSQCIYTKCSSDLYYEQNKLYDGTSNCVAICSPVNWKNQQTNLCQSQVKYDKIDHFDINNDLLLTISYIHYGCLTIYSSELSIIFKQCNVPIFSTDVIYLNSDLTTILTIYKEADGQNYIYEYQIDIQRNIAYQNGLDYIKEASQIYFQKLNKITSINYLVGSTNGILFTYISQQSKYARIQYKRQDFIEQIIQNINLGIYIITTNKGQVSYFDMFTDKQIQVVYKEKSQFKILIREYTALIVMNVDNSDDSKIIHLIDFSLNENFSYQTKEQIYGVIYDKDQNIFYSYGDNIFILNYQLQLVQIIKAKKTNSQFKDCQNSSQKLICLQENILDFQQKQYIQYQVLIFDKYTKITQVVDTGYTNQVPNSIKMVIDIQFQNIYILDSIKSKIYDFNGIQILEIEKGIDKCKIQPQMMVCESLNKFILIDRISLVLIDLGIPEDGSTILNYIYIDFLKYLLFQTSGSPYQVSVLDISTKQVINSFSSGLLQNVNGKTDIVDFQLDKNLSNCIMYLDKGGTFYITSLDRQSPFTNYIKISEIYDGNEDIRFFYYNDITNDIFLYGDYIYKIDYSVLGWYYDPQINGPYNLFTKIFISSSQTDYLIFTKQNNTIFRYSQQNLKFELDVSGSQILDIQYNQSSDVLIIAKEDSLLFYQQYQFIKKNQLLLNIQKLNDIQFKEFIIDSLIITNDQKIIQLNIQTGEIIYQIQFNSTQLATSFNLNKNKDLLAVGFSDGQVLLFNTTNQAYFVHGIITDSMNTSIIQIQFFENSDNQQFVYAVSNGGILLQINIDNKKLISLSNTIQFLQVIKKNVMKDKITNFMLVENVVVIIFTDKFELFLINGNNIDFVSQQSYTYPIIVDYQFDKQSNSLKLIGLHRTGVFENIQNLYIEGSISGCYEIITNPKDLKQQINQIVPKQNQVQTLKGISLIQSEKWQSYIQIQTPADQLMYVIKQTSQINNQNLVISSNIFNNNIYIQNDTFYEFSLPKLQLANLNLDFQNNTNLSIKITQNPRIKQIIFQNITISLNCFGSNQIIISDIEKIVFQNVKIIGLDFTQSQKCQKNQIFDTLSQSCLSCSSVCEDCFNIGSQSCINCGQNSYQNYDDISTCSIQCQKNEIVDNQSKRCIKCQVSGCVQCTAEQICLACDQNLELDSKNNQCNSKQGICESNFQFLTPPFSSKECTISCPQSYYQNYSSQICEQIQQCPHIQQLSSSLINSQVKQIEIFKQNQYIIASSDYCKFSLADENWKIVTKETLQKRLTPTQSKSLDNTFIENFISGQIGGCLQGQRFNVMNFETLQVEFDEYHLEYYYKILFVDEQHQLVFMTAERIVALVWYDMRNKKINSIQIPFGNYTLFKILNRYYIQANEINQLLIGAFQEDFSISIENSKKGFSVIPTKVLLQKKNYAITQTVLGATNNFYKITFELNGQIQDQTLVLQISQISSQIFSGQSLDLIVLYDITTNQMLLIQFNDTYDLVLINQVISTENFAYVTARENLILNSYFIFVEKIDYYQFANITDAISKFQNNNNQIVLNYKQIKKTFLNYSFINFMIWQDEVQIFFCKQNSNDEQFGAYNTCIRIKYYLYKSNNNLQLEYLNPYQTSLASNQQLYVKQMVSLQQIPYLKLQNQINIQTNQKLEFYQINFNKLLQKFIISKQNILYQLTNLQKNSRILTTNQNLLLLQQTLESVNRIIDNQYLVTSVITGLGVVQEYVTDIQSKKLVISYNFQSNFKNSNFYYIKSKKMLIVQNNFLIVDLANQKIFANLTNIQGNFIVVKDSYLIILNIQDQSLYQLDLLKANLVKIFSFTPAQKFVDFMLIDQINKYPAIINDDIIYLQDKDFSFQQFSISQSTLQSQLVNLGSFNQSQFGQFLISNITKQILVISSNNIKAYTFDLQYIDIILSGDFIQNFYYDGNSIYFFTNEFFYKFDPLTKQLVNLATNNTAINSQHQKDLENYYYRLDDSQYFKKADKIIDSKNMMIIKTQQEDNIYIGQIQQGDSQIHYFQSQNAFYWHKNLFNNPFRVLNLKTQSQIFLAQQFSNYQNWVAVYDANVNQITIYNQTDLFKVIQMNFQLQLDLNIVVLNWISLQLIYVNSNSLYLFSPFSVTQVNLLYTLESKIVQYKVCTQQSIIVALSTQNNIYSINMQDKSNKLIKLENTKCKSNIDMKYILFDLDCDQKLIILSQPCFEVFDLETGQRKFNQ